MPHPGYAGDVPVNPPPSLERAAVGDAGFALGSAVWPGTSKLIEEQGELIQVLGKLMALGGSTDHWSGDLRKMLVEELADVQAAIVFFEEWNLTPDEAAAVTARIREKRALFAKWHANPELPAPEPR
jgi:hypothetical protein